MKILKSLLVLSCILGCNAYSNSVKYKIIAGNPHFNNESFVEVYGHRGDRSYSPENSLSSYRTALSVGVDWVDLDITFTQDGVIVVYHDLWINPDFTSIHGNFFAKSKEDFFIKLLPNTDNKIQQYLLKNIKFADLEKYDIGVLNPESPYSKLFPDQFSILNTKIPTLQSVIDYVDQTTKKSLMYQIEIKNDPLNPNWTLSPKELAQNLYQVLKKNNLIKRTEVQSFDWSILYELQKINKNIKTAYLVGYDDRARMQESNITNAGLWSGGKLLKDYNNSLPQMIKTLGGSCYEPEDVTLTKEELEEAHRLGLKVVVWTWPEHSGTTFNAKLIEKLISWGVDGIITDDPGRLNSMLAARGYRVPKNYGL